MKWKMLRLLEKVLSTTLAFKPLQASLDRIGHWRDRHSVLVRRILLSCLLSEFVGLMFSLWMHFIIGSIMTGTFTLCYLVLIHQKLRRYREDDEWSDPDEPSPTGDTVERWLRERSRLVEK